MTVLPSSCKLFRISIISLVELESRLPVGSSASMTNSARGLSVKRFGMEVKMSKAEKKMAQNSITAKDKEETDASAQILG